MSNPTIRDFSVLLLLASTATSEQPCTGDDAESCKVDNTARLTWTLLGVLMLTNMLLLCLLCLAYCHLRRKICQLSHKMTITNTPMHVITNSNPECGEMSEDLNTPSSGQVTASPSTINTSVSEPISFLHLKSARDSGDYSTVVDAVVVSSKGRKSKRCPPLLNPSTSLTVHPFSGASATNAANKLATDHKKPLRAAPPVPNGKQQNKNPRSIGKLEHSYDHIVDGLSPVDGDTAASVTPASPPQNSTAAKKTTSTNTTTSEAVASTTVAAEELDGRVYSSPIPGGMKQYRRMTGSHNMNKRVKGASEEREQNQHTRPKSALGIHPPLDSDIYTSSCNSSPALVRKKFTKTCPVSAHYNEPL